MNGRALSFGLIASVWLAACGHSAGTAPRSAATLKSSQSPTTAGDGAAAGEGGGAVASSEAPVAAAASAPGAAAPSARKGAALEQSESDQALSPDRSRPGLGTSWGEARASRVSSTTFDRQSGHPFAMTAINYNDESGVAAMTRGRFVDWTESVVPLGSGVTVSITDPSGRPLRAARVDGRTITVGRDGDRYVIRVENRSPGRVEAVATVDGLDVVDGRDGDPAKRGYVIPAYDTLEIEGFRDSEGSVRAFRFGATDDSYASRRGKGRNVGVIGVAVYLETGSDPRWTPEEVRRRQDADPFPNRYAPPPPPSVLKAQ